MLLLLRHLKSFFVFLQLFHEKAVLSIKVRDPFLAMGEDALALHAMIVFMRTYSQIGNFPY